ncbi:MAG TPA: hypothetical protein VKY89_18830 [Thermoanaerobaculia bacterium]|nr:hypothetical protein [Thermoanaerobaculia bacterium]
MRLRIPFSTIAGTAWPRLALVGLLLLACCDGAAAAACTEGEMANGAQHDGTAQPGTPGTPEAPAAIADGVRIDRPTVSVPLPIASAGPQADRLRQDLAAPAGPGRVELVLDGITVAAPPRVMFDVYLSTLSTAGPKARRQYVGTLSFFGVDHRSGQRSLPARSFDVTEQLAALAGAGASHELSEVQVVFAATDGTAGSTPAKAGPQLNPQAGLRVGSLSLVLK